MFGLTPYRGNRGLTRTDDFYDFYDLVNNFFNDAVTPFGGMQNNNIKLDLRENDNEYVIDAELAGFNKDEINLDFDKGSLLISASKQNESNEEQGNYIHKERSYSSMQRAVYLKNATGDNIKAKFENGVLQITVPKSDNISNTRIPIQ